MTTSNLPALLLDDGSIQVGRETLEGILDRLPPPAEMRCQTILREARYDTIWLNRINTHPYALTDHDWPYVMEALGLRQESTREALIEDLWHLVKTNGLGARERTGLVLDELERRGLLTYQEDDR